MTILIADINTNPANQIARPDAHNAIFRDNSNIYIEHKNLNGMATKTKAKPKKAKAKAKPKSQLKYPHTSYGTIIKYSGKIAVDASQIAGYARKKDMARIVYNLATLIKKLETVVRAANRIQKAKK